MNLYDYASGDPVNGADPSGLATIIPLPSDVLVTGRYNNWGVGYNSSSPVLTNLILQSTGPPPCALSSDPTACAANLENCRPNNCQIIPLVRPCPAVSARVLKGNSNLVGKPGAFSTANKTVAVRNGSAAIIPSEFGMTKSQLRPYLGRIIGTIGGKALFSGVTDVIDNAVSPVPGMSTRDALESLNPGSIILEVPGLANDMGTQNVVLSAPASVNCPKAPSR
jgi:hypothetical protein